MKRISIYTRSGNICPSSYYRILQYQDNIGHKIINNHVFPNRIFYIYGKATGLKRKFYQLVFYNLIYARTMYFFLRDLIIKPDVIFISRAIIPRVLLLPTHRFLMGELLKRTKKVIWDIDDNIFENKELTKYERILLEKYSTHIIVLSEYLKDILSVDSNKKIYYLPTTDGTFDHADVSSYICTRKKRYDSGEVCLLWLATFTNLPFLEDIVPYLECSAKYLKEKYSKTLVLEVVCNRTLNINTKYLQINNIEWSKEVAIERMKNAHIGIMPLRYNRQTLGKGGFKLIQYMSTGLATIGSDVGYSSDVIINDINGFLTSHDNLNEWTESVNKLASSWENIEKFGLKSRLIWEEKFSYQTNLDMLKKIILED